MKAEQLVDSIYDDNQEAIAFLNQNIYDDISELNDDPELEIDYGKFILAHIDQSSSPMAKNMAFHMGVRTYADGTGTDTYLYVDPIQFNKDVFKNESNFCHEWQHLSDTDSGKYLTPPELHGYLANFVYWLDLDENEYNNLDELKTKYESFYKLAKSEIQPKNHGIFDEALEYIIKIL